ncbi:3-keto-L-gulonate-6-phosphate decarboxylase [Micromonospora echinospora]|uniref:3-keto-L-gulonate-6-phosphate decarboxylase n=2 Tax=Micromonospora echinospora TaxID=1877 RepID=A0A1C4WHF9_MICEC|nr:3-keto-L-gulonate-6-phosphate decarboxylase [Micromonospora echinospora]
MSPDGLREAKRALGSKLAAWRKTRGLRQQDIAEGIPTSRSSVAGVETGAQVVDEDFWLRCDALLDANGELIAAYRAYRMVEHEYQTEREEAARRARWGSSAPVSRHPRALLADRTASLPGTGGVAPEETLARDGLGARSSQRTVAILAALERQRSESLYYLPPVDIKQVLSGFLSSASRAYLITGPPGCGKTRLARHLADEAAGFDVQLLAGDLWAEENADLAREILRYASSIAGPDPLLALERESKDLTRPLLVVIDNPRTRMAIDRVCRQLDRVLRQVLSERLRFVLILRTPPEIELAPYPVLAASVASGQSQNVGSSLQLGLWDTSTARRVWDRSRSTGQPAFDVMPTRLRGFARLPLYMSLMRAAGETNSDGQTNSFRLVEFCVESILKSSGLNPDQAIYGLARSVRLQLLPTLPRNLTNLLQKEFTREDSERAVAQTATLSLAASSALDHDVIREYLFARWLARVVESWGSSPRSVALLNELASATTGSADLRGILEFLLQGLDATSPELLAAMAKVPAASVIDTVPLMLELVGDNAAFATGDVLRDCARRCLQPSGLLLARALLRSRAAAAALGGDYLGWILRVLRQFGPPIWVDIVTCVDGRLSVTAIREFVQSARLDSVDDAVFFARHFFVFFGDDDIGSDAFKVLLGHPDWRVRAALGDALGDERVAARKIPDAILGSLVEDLDYKVRAAVAAALGQSDITIDRHRLKALLFDRNWHVRERLLQGLSSRQGSTTDVADLAFADEAVWRDGPQAVRVAVQRLLLKAGRPAIRDEESFRNALFGLLRELKSGALTLPADVQSRLINEGLVARDWLVEAEAKALAGHRAAIVAGPNNSKEMFRRLRDRRSLQIALDVRDLQQAVAVAEAAVAAGVRLIEIGDPLIKSAGVRAIGEVKKQVPEATVVAEMMSADWGRDQVVLASEAGADVVLLIGPASVASVSAAVGASRRLGVPLMLDVPQGRLAEDWVRDMERAGVDAFAITTNIDLGVAGNHPLDQAELLRSWTQLPVAVSGGFEPTDMIVRDRRSWDILVVGRGVTDALDPVTAARDLVASVGLSGRMP